MATSTCRLPAVLPGLRPRPGPASPTNPPPPPAPRTPWASEEPKAARAEGLGGRLRRTPPPAGGALQFPASVVGRGAAAAVGPGSGGGEAASRGPGRLGAAHLGFEPFAAAVQVAQLA